MPDPATKIEHIIIVMMENRSFDHMLGYLSLEGHPVDGLTPTMSNRDGKGVEHKVFELDDPVFAGRPCIEPDCIATQLKDGNSGFIQSFEATEPQAVEAHEIMGYYGPKNVPVYDFLAKEFGVIDRWFGSVPGPTMPNRAYAYAGTPEGHPRTQSAKDFYFLEAKTFFEHLTELKVSWAYYESDLGNLRFYERYAFGSRIKRLYRRRLVRLLHKTRLTFLGRRWDGMRRALRRWIRSRTNGIDTIGRFFKQVEAGELPSVSWIDPTFLILNRDCDHSIADIRRGQEFVGKIYNAIRGGPNQLFERSLLLVVYDEHGGFYDHVEPPAVAKGEKGGVADRYGPRVPALVISPWIERGSVFSGGGSDTPPFDHTSIPKTVLARFGEERIAEMGPRVAAAPELWPLLTLKEPRTELPEAPGVETWSDVQIARYVASKRHGDDDDLARLEEKDPDDIDTIAQLFPRF